MEQNGLGRATCHHKNYLFALKNVEANRKYIGEPGQQKCNPNLCKWIKRNHLSIFLCWTCCQELQIQGGTHARTHRSRTTRTRTRKRTLELKLKWKRRRRQDEGRTSPVARSVGRWVVFSVSRLAVCAAVIWPPGPSRYAEGELRLGQEKSHQKDINT